VSRLAVSEDVQETDHLAQVRCQRSERLRRSVSAEDHYRHGRAGTVLSGPRSLSHCPSCRRAVRRSRSRTRMPAFRTPRPGRAPALPRAPARGPPAGGASSQPHVRFAARDDAHAGGSEACARKAHVAGGGPHPFRRAPGTAAARARARYLRFRDMPRFGIPSSRKGRREQPRIEIAHHLRSRHRRR
jgi:hypothetical protein